MLARNASEDAEAQRESAGYRALVLVVCGLALIAAAFVGRYVPAADQLRLNESLRTLSSIVFAVVGAWIALIYPRALEQVLDKTAGDAQVTNVLRLLRPLMYSTAVLIFGLVFDVLAVTLPHLSWSQAWIPALRSSAFVVLTALVLMQLYATLMTLLPTDVLRQELENLRATSEYRRKLLSGTD